MTVWFMAENYRKNRRQIRFISYHFLRHLGFSVSDVRRVSNWNPTKQYVVIINTINGVCPISIHAAQGGSTSRDLRKACCNAPELSENQYLKGGSRKMSDNSEEFDFSGNFVNAENTIEGDIFEISAKPFPEEKESANEKVLINGVLRPKKYMVLNIPVIFDGRSKQYSPDSKTGLRFQTAWGKKHADWVGKKFQVKIESYKAYGADKKRVIGFPL